VKCQRGCSCWPTPHKREFIKVTQHHFKKQLKTLGLTYSSKGMQYSRLSYRMSNLTQKSKTYIPNTEHDLTLKNRAVSCSINRNPNRAIVQSFRYGYPGPPFTCSFCSFCICCRFLSTSFHSHSAHVRSSLFVPGSIVGKRQTGL
jgi:hypothetical protein